MVALGWFLFLFFQFVTCEFGIFYDALSSEFPLDFTSAAMEHGFDENNKELSLSATASFKLSPSCSQGASSSGFH